MQYALIQDGKVTNVIEWDGDSDTWSPPQGVSAAPIGVVFVDVGYAFDGETFKAPAVAAETITAEQARSIRDVRIAATDWTQLGDVPAATAAKWAPYRQALRDVPEQPGFPSAIEWPEVPA